MTIANSTSGVWLNSDGLRVKFPQEEIRKAHGGEFNMLSSTHLTELDIDYTEVALGTGATVVWIVDHDIVFPDGATIEKVDFYVTSAWDSSSSDVALNFGLVKRGTSSSDYGTIIDADGLMDSVAKTVIDAVGNLVVTQVAGSYPDITTYGGALLGTALAYDSLVCTFWENHVPTSGAGKLRIYWRPAIVA